MSRCFSKFPIEFKGTRALCAAMMGVLVLWYKKHRDLALYRTIWSRYWVYVCYLKTRYLCPWLHLSVSWGRHTSVCWISVQLHRQHGVQKTLNFLQTPQHIVAQTRNASPYKWLMGQVPGKKNSQLCFPKKEFEGFKWQNLKINDNSGLLYFQFSPENQYLSWVLGKEKRITKHLWHMCVHG